MKDFLSAEEKRDWPRNDVTYFSGAVSPEANIVLSHTICGLYNFELTPNTKFMVTGSVCLHFPFIRRESRVGLCSTHGPSELNFSLLWITGSICMCQTCSCAGLASVLDLTATSLMSDITLFHPMGGEFALFDWIKRSEPRKERLVDSKCFHFDETMHKWPCTSKVSGRFTASVPPVQWSRFPCVTHVYRKTWALANRLGRCLQIHLFIGWQLA